MNIWDFLQLGIEIPAFIILWFGVIVVAYAAVGILFDTGGGDEKWPLN